MFQKNINNNNSGFYEVICLTGGLPTVLHSDESSAIAEAKRLAKLNPTKVFEVVKIVANVRATLNVCVSKEEIPFQVLRGQITKSSSVEPAPCQDKRNER